MKRGHWAGWAWLGLIAGALLGCSRAPVVTVENRSGQVISNLVVSGTGYSVELGELPSGKERRVTVHPSGESGLKLQFEVGGRKVASGPDGYIESRGGYRVRAVVETNLGVVVTTGR